GRIRERCVSYFTLRIIIILMKTIKDLYQTSTPLAMARQGKGPGATRKEAATERDWTRDTAADPQRAAAAVDELARLGVAALAGGDHSVVAPAAAARADALRLPFLCSSAGLHALTQPPTKWVRRPPPG